MKSIILTDKSALEFLTEIEIELLYKYYYVNIPPILIKEIRADLIKTARAFPKEHVTNLAKRLLRNDSRINVDYSDLILNELMGQSVPMDGRTIVASEATSTNEKPIDIISEEEKNVKRWQRSDFDDSDYEFAHIWHSSISQIDLADIRATSFPVIKFLQDSNISNSNITDLNNFIISFLKEVSSQSKLLELILEINRIHLKDSSLIFCLWESNNKPLLEKFCPYSFFCLHAFLFWHLLVQKGIFVGGQTSLIDLEYIFYLPFTQIFVSNDRYHKEIVQFFIRKNQTFLTGENLRTKFKDIYIP
ncbi:MAG: hypothetical protein HYZ54_09035 [Ignavibacteriae bacterium]|nr:hypothetical protein [Ignavibacteriota bacterium]